MTRGLEWRGESEIRKRNSEMERQYIVWFGGRNEKFRVHDTREEMKIERFGGVVERRNCETMNKN